MRFRYWQALFVATLTAAVLLLLRQMTEGNHQSVHDISGGNICQSARSVIYTKTHKTGGSSVGALLLQYVKKHELQRNALKQIDILPGPYFGGYPGRFQTRFAFKIPNDIKPDDMKNASRIHYAIGHFRFNNDVILSMMSKETKYITMLRNPLRQVESAFHYYYAKYTDIATENDKVPVQGVRFARHLACHPEPFLTVARKLGVSYADYIRLAHDNLNTDVPWFYRGSNSQAFDLGLDPQITEEEDILRKAKELDSTFDLVMITDYFLESLILLKNTLCMAWEDLLGPRVNAGSYEPHIYTAEEERKIWSLNKQDFVLFAYFNHTFWQKVDAYGRDKMEKEVNYLKKILNDYGTATKRNIFDQKLEHLGTFVSKNEGRDYHVRHTAKLIKDEIGQDLSEAAILEIAGYMFDNGGWCPHRHPR